MTKQPTVLDLVKFIVKNRKGKVFRNWSIVTIAKIFSTAFEEGRAGFVTDNEGNLTGVALVVFGYDKRRIHCKAVLTTNKESLKLLIGKLIELYGSNNFTFTATRRGQEVVYDVNKLYSKVCALCN